MSPDVPCPEKWTYEKHEQRMKIRLPVSMLQARDPQRHLVAAPLALRRRRQRFSGTITAINGTTLTVKTDAGGVQPGRSSCHRGSQAHCARAKGSERGGAIQFTDLATGDRVLVKLDPNATAARPQALQIIAIKQPTSRRSSRRIAKTGSGAVSADW